MLERTWPSLWPKIAGRRLGFVAEVADSEDRPPSPKASNPENSPSLPLATPAGRPVGRNCTHTAAKAIAVLIIQGAHLREADCRPPWKLDNANLR